MLDADTGHVTGAADLSGDHVVGRLGMTLLAVDFARSAPLATQVWRLSAHHSRFDNAEHAGAHISTVNAGHLSLMTRPDPVVKTILAASDATS